MKDTIYESTLWNQLSEFVANVCCDRDDSHGHKHMETVAVNALKIFDKERQKISEYDVDKLERYIIITAWLHDVADHKYDKDNRLKIVVSEFTKSVVDSEDDVELILNIIDHISYSKENRALILGSGTPIDFRSVLGGFGEIVRNIVSDADKLEALGKIGFDRCVDFTKHSYKEKYGVDISYDALKNNVIAHSHEKLLRLKDEFIRTEYGKQLAIPLHNELVIELNNMNCIS